MHESLAANLDGSSVRIGIVISRYHREITDALLAGAIDAFKRAGGSDDRLMIIDAPGSWELTAICRALALQTEEPPPHAIVALGCVITGETTHDQYIAQSVTQGLTAIIVQTGMPIAFGVLTCKTLEQARARSIDAKAQGGAGGMNKGAEAMRAAIASANAVRHLQQVDRSVR
jgi:6,7-dimethyl-8-ribityllumazine synthase